MKEFLKGLLDQVLVGLKALGLGLFKSQGSEALKLALKELDELLEKAEAKAKEATFDGELGENAIAEIRKKLSELMK